MPKGVELVDIHMSLLYIDGAGNLVLNTAGKLAEQVQTGILPTFLVKGGQASTAVGPAAAVAITNGPGASANISNVSFQVQDAFGNNVSGVFLITIYLSDAATGGGLTATTASGGIAAAASGGVIFDAIVTSKAVDAQTTTGGLFVLAITDTAKTGFYPVVARGSAITVGAQLTTASYHT